MKIRSIKTKFTLYNGAMLVLLLLLSNAFVLIYFQTVLTYENISKDLSVLKSEALQIDSLVNNIRGIAQSIVLDSRVQRFCSRRNILTYQEVVSVSDTLHALVQTEHLVHSVVLRHNGASYWSQYPFDRQLQQWLSEPWASNISKIENAFTASHWITLGYSGAKEVITYRAIIYDINHPVDVIGELFLNINAAPFHSTISETRKNAVNILWNESGLLFAEEAGMFPYMNEHAALAVDRKKSGAKQVSDGYLLWHRLENGWSLLTYAPKTELHGRSDGLILFFIFFVPITVVFSMSLVYSIITKLTDPIREVTKVMKNYANGERTAHVVVTTGDELEVMGNQFNAMVERINENIEHILEDERIQKKIRFDLLMSKIHPHFIYNTLNTAIFLSHNGQNEDVTLVLKSLISILQDSMSVHSDKIIDSVETEVAVVAAYAAIQRYKYKDKFTMHYAIDQDTLALGIPKNILQPLVENSIFHGIAPQDTNGNITLSVTRMDQMLCVTVSDDGVGMETNTLACLQRGERAKNTAAEHSIGIASIRERLDYVYGGAQEIILESEQDIGTVIQLMLPIHIRLELMREEDKK